MAEQLERIKQQVPAPNKSMRPRHAVAVRPIRLWQRIWRGIRA